MKALSEQQCTYPTVIIERQCTRCFSFFFFSNATRSLAGPYIEEAEEAWCTVQKRQLCRRFERADCRILLLRPDKIAQCLISCVIVHCVTIIDYITIERNQRYLFVYIEIYCSCCRLMIFNKSSNICWTLTGLFIGSFKWRKLCDCC